MKIVSETDNFKDTINRMPAGNGQLQAMSADSPFLGNNEWSAEF